MPAIAVGIGIGFVSTMGGASGPAPITGSIAEVSPARSSLITGAQAIKLHEYVTSVSVLEAHQGDYGLAVSQWDDLSGNAKHATQGTGSLQPTIGDLGGLDTLIFDGTDDYMQSSLVLPAPGTTPTYIHFVARQLSWETNGPWLGDAGTTNCAVVYQNGGTPNVRCSNATASSLNAGAAVNTWVRGEVYLSNSTADLLKLGSTTVTGTALGNLAGATGRRIAFRPGSVYGHVEFFSLLYANGLPSADERAALDSAIVGLFGSGVVTL